MSIATLRNNASLNRDYMHSQIKSSLAPTYNLENNLNNYKLFGAKNPSNLRENIRVNDRFVTNSSLYKQKNSSTNSFITRLIYDRTNKEST
jgi:hypothetical protein